MELKLYNKEEVLNFIEFNTTGDNENYNKCDSESKYLPLYIFNIFVECFENSNPLFEIFGETKYNSRKIVPLKNQIVKKLREIEEIHSVDIFRVYVKQTFLGAELLESFVRDNENWEENWTHYHEQVIKVGEELLDLADDCMAGDKILWTIGL